MKRATLFVLCAVVGCFLCVHLLHEEDDSPPRSTETGPFGSSQQGPPDRSSRANRGGVVAKPFRHRDNDLVSTVQVLSAETRSPVAGAQVYIIGAADQTLEDSTICGVTDTEGLVETPAGSILHVVHPEYVRKTVDLQRFEEGDRTVVEVRPAGRLRCRLTDLHGLAVSGMRVRLGPSLFHPEGDASAEPLVVDGGRRFRAISGPDGRFEVRGLPRGKDIWIQLHTTAYFVRSRRMLIVRVPESAEAPEHEIQLLPLMVATVVVKGYPMGWSYKKSLSLPRGARQARRVSSPATPIQSYRNQLLDRRRKIRDALTGAGIAARDDLIIVEFAVAADPAGASAAHTDNCNGWIAVGESDRQMIDPLRWRSVPDWRVEDCHVVSVDISRPSGIGLVNLTYPKALGGSKTARVPLRIRSVDNGTVYDIPGDPEARDQAILRLPFGRYSIAPRYFIPWPAGSRPVKHTKFTVDSKVTNVALRAGDPVPIVTVKVMDNFGRRTERFGLSYDGRFRVHTSGFRNVAVPHRTWTFSVMPEIELGEPSLRIEKTVQLQVDEPNTIEVYFTEGR